MNKEELEQKAKEYRKEADFINNLYGISDIDHETALEVGHIYDLMNKFSQYLTVERKDRDDKAQKDNELIMMERIEELENGLEEISNGIEEESGEEYLQNRIEQLLNK